MGEVKFEYTLGTTVKKKYHSERITEQNPDDFECTLVTTVKKNVPLRPGHGAIQNNCCWFIGEVADLNQLAHYNNTAKC